MKSKREFMQERAQLIDAQEAILNGALAAGRAMTAEEKATFDAKQKEIDALTATIDALDAVDTRRQVLNQPVNPPWRPGSALQGGPVQGDVLDDCGFASFGEFVAAVRWGDPKGRLSKLKTTADYMNVNTSDVAVMIPPQFAAEIMALSPGEEIVMPNAEVIQPGDPPDAEFSVPYLSQGADGVLAGVQVFWTEEGQAVPEATPKKIEKMTLLPHEVTGYITVTDKTLRNWQAASGWIQERLRMAFVMARDLKFIRGSGAGVPLGFLHERNTGAIEVIRATSGTVIFDDIANMEQALLPEAADRAFWIASQSLKSTIIRIKDADGRPIWLPGNIANMIPETLLGKPIRWTGKVPARGNRGDLSLVCLKPYYQIKLGSGPFLATSSDVKFLSNETVIKLVAYVDAQSWVKAPLRLEDGVTDVSPFVILK